MHNFSLLFAADFQANPTDISCKKVIKNFPLIDGDAKDTARLVNDQNHFFGLGTLDILFFSKSNQTFWSLSVVQKEL